MPEGLTVVQHPVLDDRLVDPARRGHAARRLPPGARARRRRSSPIEATRDLPTVEHTVDTPLEPAPGAPPGRPRSRSCPSCAPGLGMVDGFLRLLPDARVGHLGMYRDEEDARAGRLLRAPAARHRRRRRLRARPDARHRRQRRRTRSRRLKANGARQLRAVCLVAAPEGVAAVREAHPDVPIWTAALDRQLDENGYIRPGLGDAGDRVFGTTG